MVERRAFLLIDANHLLHRVLHVPQLAGLKRSDARYGRPMDKPERTADPGTYGGVFGFLLSLRASLEHIDPRRCVAVWDGGHSARRLKLFPTYKHHDKMSESEAKHRELFLFNRPVIKRILPLLGVRSLTVPEKEADDVLWEADQMASELGIQYRVIMSEDQDFAQMVREGTDVYQPIKDVWLKEQTIEKQLGMSRSRYVLYRAIVGDKSDEIPGVKGAGKVTARTIMENAESIRWDDLEAFCASHRSKLVRRVSENMDVVKRNWKLMRLGKEAFDDDQLDRIQRAIEVPVKSDLTALRGELDDLRFDSITQRFSWWVLPFQRAGAKWGSA